VDEDALDRTPAILVGHICHAVLENWPFESAKRAPDKRLAEAVDAAARRFGLLPENPERDAVAAECAEILKTFLSSDAFLAIAAAKIEGREVPFFYPLPGAGDDPRLMRGAMDLVYRDAGGLVVADYKTNRVDAKTLEAVSESYRPQGAVYVEALKKITGETAAFELVFLRTGERRRLAF
jgi:ATP-dependent exoDNAse (exonuclease V) beta subunit